MSNCPNPDNKLLKDTSDVIYNSTPLPCTNVSPYDSLNTILTKFDTKICEIEESVSTLSDNITNLTEDVMVITEDILAINSRLDTCCTTTTAIPSYSFLASVAKALETACNGIANKTVYSNVSELDYDEILYDDAGFTSPVEDGWYVIDGTAWEVGAGDGIITDYSECV